MRRKYAIGLFGAVLQVATACAATPGESTADARNSALHFEKNLGQAEPGVRFLARHSELDVALGSAGIRLQPRRQSGAFHLQFPGAKSGLTFEAAGPLPSVSNYLSGSDESKWIRNVPHYREVRATEVYSGVDMVFYGTGRQFEFDFVVRPGARPEQIRVSYEGLGPLVLNADGSVAAKLGEQEIVQRPPEIYQTDAQGKRRKVHGEYYLADSRTLGFRVSGYDPAMTLVIDPVVTYGSFVGGPGNDSWATVAIDPAKNFYLAYSSRSFRSDVVGTQGFLVVEKYTPAGALVWASRFGNLFCGKPCVEWPNGIAVDPQGQVSMVGFTSGNSFPLKNAIFTKVTTDPLNPAGGMAPFVLKLNAAGNGFLFSTYYGQILKDGVGGGQEIRGVGADDLGNTIFLGFVTTPPTLLVTAAQFMDPAKVAALTATNNAQYAYVAKLDNNGGLAYSVLLGTSGPRNPAHTFLGCDPGALAVDRSGAAYVAGKHCAALETTPGGNTSLASTSATGWLAKLDPTGTALQYATYLTGISDISSLAVDSTGATYISGNAIESLGATPTPGAYQSSPYPGDPRMCLLKMNPTGTNVSFLTYIGTDTHSVSAPAIAVDSSFRPHVLFNATTTGRPVLNAFYTTVPPYNGPLFPNSSPSLFLMRLNAGATALDYATHISPDYLELGMRSIAIDSDGVVYATGITKGPAPITENAAFKNYGGFDSDGFIARIAPDAPSACTYTLSADATSLTLAGGTVNLRLRTTPISSGCNWNLTLPSWITSANPVSGSGWTDATLTVGLNAQPPRLGTISAGGQNITIYQSGAGACTITPGQTNLSVPSAGAPASQLALTVAPGTCGWRAASSVGWLRITANATGTGSGTTTYTVDPNTNASQRTGAITVGSQTVTVTQAGGSTCTITPGQTSISVPSAGRTATQFSLTASASLCAWQATSSVAWVQITANSSGTGSGSFTYTVDPNTGTNQRTGAITVGSQTVTVTQAGASACTITPGQTSISVPSAGRTATQFSVTASTSLCAWQATSGVAWVQITANSSGTGSGSFTYTVDPNTGTNQRTGTITVDSQTVPVAQAGASGTPTLSLNRTALTFGGLATGLALTPPQEVFLTMTGGSSNWTASSDSAWLAVTPAAGAGSGRFSVSIVPSALPAAGTYAGKITVNAAGATNGPLAVNCTLSVKSASTAPFGSFDTPVDYTTGVSGSIAVTGWALDDVGVKKVSIWRDPFGPEPVQANGYVYIGDTLFVAGARPDVEGKYPGTPGANRAGWGYMMLTYGLPAKGNGTYKIHAIATDVEGNQVKLGTKTITVDNARSTKPFGAIDSPAPGETVSGTVTVYGWALTPPPCGIATDGSTISVYVNGVDRGHPNYGQPRPDVGSLFPGYTNRNFAGGSYSLNSMQYGNGLSTLAWVVTDNCGPVDGMGSRFFTIQNGVTGASADPEPMVDEDRAYQLRMARQQRPAAPVAGYPAFRQGYDPNTTLTPIRQAGEGLVEPIELKELDRLEVHLPEGQSWTAGLRVGDELRELPIGSTFDAEGGIFYWQLGPVYLGEYVFEFRAADGTVLPVPVRVGVGTAPAAMQ